MRLPCVLLSALSSLAAQSIVYPSSHQSIANGSTYQATWPLSAGITRVQILFEDWDLNLPANTPITRIGFRQDGAQAAASQLLQLEVRLGTTLLNSTTLGNTFDTNFASPPTTVFPLGVFTLPTFTSTSNATVWINLPTPWVYPGGNLLAEFRVYGNNNGNQGFYYPFDAGSFVSPRSQGQPGCPHSGNQTPVLTNQPTAIGSNWNLSLQSAPAGTAVALFVAFDQELVPGYSLAALGLAPACLGQLPPTGLAAFSATTSTSGGVSWNVQIPFNLALNNVTISSQAVAFDFFSQGNLVVSNGASVKFGVNPQQTMVYAQGSATATTGSQQQNLGLITLFN
jgi:hypothetical protein